MNFFDHKGLGNHLLQLCPKVVKNPVYGPTYENGYRKITMNQENYDKFKTPDVVIITEVLRLD